MQPVGGAARMPQVMPDPDPEPEAGPGPGAGKATTFQGTSSGWRCAALSTGS